MITHVLSLQMIQEEKCICKWLSKINRVFLRERAWGADTWSHVRIRSVFHISTGDCNKQKPRIATCTRLKGEIGFIVWSGIKWISLLRDQLFSPCFFPFPSSAFADQQKRKMNASISDAEAPFSHLLRSRFHIKPVIAYDPARHNSHSGGPCYMNEIWWNANIYAHTFTFRASLIIASTSVLKKEQLSLEASNYSEEYANRCTCMHIEIHHKPPPPQNIQPHHTVQTLVCL